MIILKHLTVERFRLLRELNLHFPQRGSILIQGPNESGKSALLESIYFALYGESLASNRGKRSLDDLISYGAANATVTLALSIGATDLTVTRTLERGKGQSVCLVVRRLGTPEEEPITLLGAANERIITEIGRLDNVTLRNSCLIEQKGLDRLEHLSGVERETSLRKLLGLEKLMRLTEQFKVTPDDERLLKEASERLHLAEIQARIPELSEQLDRIEAALDVVKVCEDLDEISQQEADIAEQEQAFAQIKTSRAELKNRQHRLQQLKRADDTLAEIIAAYDGMAEARREIPELEKQILELEHREREELPVLEKRVGELSELLRSFGTLQRMSNDLLTAVDAIKELEHELKQHDEVKDDLKSLDEQVSYARSRVEEAQKALKDLEGRRSAGRPQLEMRLQNMQTLAERLATLRQLEDQYTRGLNNKEQAQKNEQQLTQVINELRETEQEMEIVEAEARQAQQEAEALERAWRQLGMRRHVEEWARLRGLTQGLSQAEQQVRLAYQHQEKIRLALDEARNVEKRYGIILGFSGGVVLICFIAAAFFGFIAHSILIPIIALVLGLVAIGAAAWSYQRFGRARDEGKAIDAQMQDAINKVRMMVVARETAARMGGNNDALVKVEQEIRSLGGNIPRSLEEAQAILQQTRERSQSLGDIQQQMQEKRDLVNAARNQVNVTMEAVAAQRKERARLEGLLQQTGGRNVEARLEEDRAALQRLHQEITLLAGQEGLPMPSVNERLHESSVFGFDPLSSPDESVENTSGIPELEELVRGTIKDTERELASLDGKLDLFADFAEQVKIHQDALDVLLSRKRVIEERNERYKTSNPALQVERAREQQMALRQALQTLQDSLRQRVRPLGVTFGQTAISNAESAARKQLEELHITLGNKLMLQEKQKNYTVQLKELQGSLGEHYKQLAKYSNTLGSWIVPPKTFAKELLALRARCQREMEEANESKIAHELEMLQGREGAAKAKIELCNQEIAEAQERISALLTQRSRPAPKSYARADLEAVWPLVTEYSIKDRERLDSERAVLEEELADLEKEEMRLSQSLQTGNEKLDLEQARVRMEQQERSYETKKRGNLIVKAVNERLMRKMVPRTEYYMQQILPLLTSGRYHDVHLTTEQEEGSISGGPFHVEVWDSTAGEYVSRSALSGGVADQLSLALRLAFTVAALPRELNAAPGFVFLDEPLSSFDRGRTKALVDVVSGELLSQHFEQIILISQSSAFDPTMFPYHVYLENGLVVESNLPVVQVANPATNGAEEKEPGATQARIPVPSRNAL